MPQNRISRKHSLNNFDTGRRGHPKSRILITNNIRNLVEDPSKYFYNIFFQGPENVLEIALLGFLFLPNFGFEF